MKGQGCLVLCLLAVGEIGAYSCPPEDQPDNYGNHEESATEVGDSDEQDAVSYYDEDSERMRRDVRRVANIQHRPQRILQAAENTRIEELARRLMDITRYYENVVGLPHRDAVNRMLAENADAANQVLRHAARNAPHVPRAP